MMATRTMPMLERPHKIVICRQFPRASLFGSGDALGAMQFVQVVAERPAALDGLIAADVH